MQLSKGTGHILFVDDDRSLGNLVAKLLPRLGHPVDVQTDSRKALAQFESDPKKYDLVITDQRMPRLDGLELARKILKIRPAIPIVLCTGYSEKVDEARAKAAGIRAFVQKPLGVESITTLVKSSLKR